MDGENRRARLVAALKPLPQYMRNHLSRLKAEAEQLRKRDDLLWYLLVSSAATQGNSRGWENLRNNRAALKSLAYSTLVTLDEKARVAEISNALEAGTVRMFKSKAKRLAANVERIESLGGLAAATRGMLALPNKDAKYQFAKSFKGIGKKYGRNVWMDIYDPDFRSTVAVDSRLASLAKALGCTTGDQDHCEPVFCDLAKEAGLEPWELDRLLYGFTEHFRYMIDGDTARPVVPSLA